ncbi:hypothetical protein PFICI_11404 [Pestalotiopsis fici W106-1]|uniref:ER membrane protein complex subunit 7 beta-sandwich domain-containing protein n=1 Tax=Pestalotiopsis fici (strain W106-1 / CGMCC3.15140) TaxID=1229662 RepID=W3WUK9_PESFW|nr:uncharacterized protein PFICI_11404 [Pestalotiopsis fici W106-1]ETS77530.1 hypothetical protein PFICI_11404 [Pestalotiopsis fici W106-1]
MRLTLPALLSALLPALGGLASSSSSSSADNIGTVSLTLTVPPAQHLPNPHVLPASTHATLTALGHPRRAAPLTVSNTFVFHNVTPGSYLADVHSAAYGFVPLRVDVLEPAAAADANGGPVVKVWETYRGNEWGNKGEEVLNTGGGGGKAASGPSFAVRCLGKKVFFQERGKFSILTILKNPMILMGLASMGIFFGMPKLVENMDPEMRAEWEEQQKKNPMSSIMGGGSSGGNPMSSFDMASFMAGSNNNNNNEGSSGNGGKKGGKR